MKPTCFGPAVLVAVLLLFFSGGPLLGQEDVTVVDDSAFSNLRRPPVPFLHDAHNETAAIEDCAVCHHVYREGSLVEDESSEDSECSECHGASAGVSTLPLANTYHLRCRGCHEDQGRGPVTCGECHVRDLAGQ